MGRTFAVADIHGRFRALVQCLNAVNFDASKDRLIVLGDVCDGGPDTKLVISKLLTLNTVLIRGNHDCLDLESEILTTCGWKKYNEISLNDKCFSYDGSKLVISDITNIIYKSRKHRQMVTISTQQVNQCVTLNHKMIVKQPSWFKYKSVPDYTPIECKDLSGRFTMLCSSTLKFDDYNVSDDMLRLIGWLLTDGYTTSPPHDYWVISQSKPYNVQEIEILLDKLNVKYSKSMRYRNITHVDGKQLKQKPYNEVTFRISSESCKLISPLFKNKQELPYWLINLSDRQFNILLESIVKGNGTSYTKTNNHIVYGMYDILSFIQLLCVTHNITATITIDNRNDPRLNITYKNQCSFDFSKKMIETKYTPVWCITTPLHNFIMRRNGRVSLTGNSSIEGARPGDEFGWALGWMLTGFEYPLWWHQGGLYTAKSYNFDRRNVPQSHIEFLKSAHSYYIDENNNLYVHGGFDERYPIEQQSSEVLMWDRGLAYKYGRGYATHPIEKYNKVFLGHTSTQGIKHDAEWCYPIIEWNVICLDTGGGWNGTLTIIDVDTLDWWSSNHQRPNHC